MSISASHGIIHWPALESNLAPLTPPYIAWHTSVGTYLHATSRFQSHIIIEDCTHEYEVPLSRSATALFPGALATVVVTEICVDPTTMESTRIHHRLGEFTGNVGIAAVLATLWYCGSYSPMCIVCQEQYNRTTQAQPLTNCKAPICTTVRVQAPLQRKGDKVGFFWVVPKKII